MMYHRLRYNPEDIAIITRAAANARGAAQHLPRAAPRTAYYDAPMYDTWNEFADRAGGRDAAFYCALENPALLRVTGEDALAFLEAQLINTLPGPGDPPRYNGYCSPGGRLHATLMVWHDHDGLLLHADPGLENELGARLGRYILRARVRIETVACDAAAGLIGAAWLPLLTRRATQDPGAGQSEALSVYRLPGAVPRLVALAAERAHLATLAGHIGRDAQTVSPETWNAARIYGGAPLITPHTGDRFIPQIVNMDALDGLSFDKGCYPGQEIIARLHYKGRRKSAMYICRAHATTTPQAGETVYTVNGGKRAIGTVVSAARLDDAHVALQAVLPITRDPRDRLETESAPGAALHFCEQLAALRA